MSNLENTLKMFNNDLFDRYIKLKCLIEEKIASRQQEIQNTEAGFPHLKSVHSIADRLIPMEKIQNLKDIEIFTFLSAVYLHDVGKIREQRFESTATHHSITGRDTIIEFASTFFLEDSEALAIGYVVEGHGPNSIANLPIEKGVTPYGILRIQFLASLLRLADDLDMCFTRAPRIVSDIVKPDNSIIKKWLFRQSIDLVNIDPTTWVIEVHSTPKDSEQLNIISREIDIVNSRLVEIRPFLRATNNIGLYYSLVDFKPDDFWLKKIVTSQIQNKQALNSIDTKQSLGIAGKIATVILRYDPLSIECYKNILAPILREKGFEPILIDEVPPEESLFSRNIELLKASEVVLALMQTAISPSLFLRIGISFGLSKKTLLFFGKDVMPIGDLCGIDIIYFNSMDDLRSQLINSLNY